MHHQKEILVIETVRMNSLIKQILKLLEQSIMKISIWRLEMHYVHNPIHQ